MNFYVTCPWCKSQFYQPSHSNCPNCGGSLPVSDGSGAGAPPPPAPRELPKSFIRATKYTNNVNTIIGMVFTLVFFWSIIFPIIGIFLWRKGLRDAKNELDPLKEGAHVQGEVSSIRVDGSKNINGKHPRIIEFTYVVDGRPYRGDVPNLMDPIDLWKKPGDKIWVVYMRDNPEISSVWPPMK